MNEVSYAIGELADAAGLSRRAVRFYVQRGLLPPPEGRGRGARYTASHLQRLERIRELQEAGRSLQEIQAILAGKLVPGPQPPIPAPAPSAEQPRRGAERAAADAWLRVTLLPGVELHFDPARAPFGAADLTQVQELVRERLRSGDRRRGERARRPDDDTQH